MAIGTVIYSVVSSSSLAPGYTTILNDLGLTTSALPNGATVDSTNISITANALRTDTAFSCVLAGVTIATGLKFAAKGTQTITTSLNLTADIISKMYAQQAITIAFVGGTQPVGSGTSNICTFSTITLTVNYQAASPCGAPTSATLSGSVVESDPTLSWSGASAGTLNAITGYEIGYADSTNNSTWGSWTGLKTVSSTSTSGSTTVACPVSRGSYRKYRIRTLGAAGTGYESGWKETASVRRDMIPLGPTSVTASPSQYVDEQITIQWSGASSATTTIKGYMIGRKNSVDGVTFDSSWSVITTITLNQTNGSYSYSYLPAVGTYSKFAVWTIDSFDLYSGETASNTIQRVAAVPCSPPTSVTLLPSIVETSLTLAWSGAASSPGNYISGYELQLQESADNAVWGDWQAFAIVSSTATSGSYSGINSPAVRGSYRRMRVRTRGSAGEVLYSSWTESNSARRNILPTPPTLFTASPESYYNATITLQWQNTVAGTSPIKNYVIQSSTSSDGVNWSGWSALTTVTSSSTSGSYQTTATSTDGVRTRYRIAVTDALDAVSSYTVSNIIQRMNRPETPIVSAPRNNSMIYSTTPRFLIKTGGTPDGRTQRIVVIINGTSYNSVTNASMFSVGGSLTNGVATIFKAPTQTLGNKTITIRCENDAGVSVEEIRNVTIGVLQVEEIVPSVTTVKATHIWALRLAAEDIRHYYGLPTNVWGSIIIQNRTQVRDWPLHIKEVRAALDAVIVAINSFDTVAAFDAPLVSWIAFSPGSPRAAVMQQVITLINLL